MIKDHCQYELWYRQNTCWSNKKGAFGGTYFKQNYSGINDQWYRKSWKAFDELDNFDKKYYC